MGIETQLRQAITVFRFTALGYPLVMWGLFLDDLVRPVPALLLVAVMAAWTLFISGFYATRGFRPPALYADLATSVIAVAASTWALELDDRSVPVSVGPLLAGPVLVWAVVGGRRRGVIAGCAVAAAGMLFRGGPTENTFSEAILFIITGLMVGHFTRLGVEAEHRLREAAARDAAGLERERLARDIHDSVLQILALVQRRGDDLGGEAAELGRLAGRQEQALRALITSEYYRHPFDGQRDVRELIGRHACDAVTIAAPATPVRLPSQAAHELAAAVTSALDNVREHCPEDTRVWLLVEDQGDQVTVTVRDDGPGIPVGRLAEAAAGGRLGVARSIEGRIQELGGEATITSIAGQGTEIELRVPRQGGGGGDDGDTRGRR
ncbi:MacS family sensor histidine kinase [Phytomonospora endophytica]|uniref:Signal transduction histidine kinase n=1 Tax=Phytomonospora endophytica TaxID=714109 RepID=A0A841F8U6_9ACTN|nr:DUF5931 domain-containing protein [Phytomonospora endophytica]MBB6032666.1 signal transduction histidine kinase [Phytomonospora endophytica]GIG66184.1 histidine kinase [Phytomonospora endophytica]